MEKLTVEEKDYGLFLDTESTKSFICVDKETGSVFFHEGAVVDPEDINFSFSEETGEITVEYLGEKEILGVAENKMAASGWVNKVSDLINAKRIVVEEELNEHLAWCEMFMNETPEKDIDLFLRSEDTATVGGHVYKPGGPGILGCAKRADVPGHFEITKKVLEELKDDKGNPLLNSNLINCISRASRLPDLIYFEDLRYHAQSTVNESYLPSDPEEDKKKYQTLLHKQIKLAKSALEENSPDFQKFLFYMGITIHMAQDLPAHQGMTNPEHAYLDHKDHSPDNSMIRCQLGEETTLFFVNKFFIKDLKEFSPKLQKFKPSQWTEYESPCNYIDLLNGIGKFLRKRLLSDDEKYQARWFDWSEETDTKKEALDQIKKILVSE